MEVKPAAMFILAASGNPSWATSIQDDDDDVKDDLADGPCCSSSKEVDEPVDADEPDANDVDEEYRTLSTSRRCMRRLALILVVLVLALVVPDVVVPAPDDDDEGSTEASP